MNRPDETIDQHFGICHFLRNERSGDYIPTNLDDAPRRDSQIFNPRQFLRP